MEVILDTNALSALLDGEPEIRGVLEQAGMIYLSPIVLGEYRFGILASRHRVEYERELEGMESEVPVLPLDEGTATHYAEIRQELKSEGSPIPWHDLWIAAQCRQHALPILSCDTHFDRVEGITRIGW
jgi:predicted nucleic acid-binding protein